MGGSSLYLSCKVFLDWSIINIREINHIHKTGIYLMNFLKQHLTAFVDLVYRCGLEKRTLQCDIFFSIKCSSGAKRGKRRRSQGYLVLVY